MTPPTQSLRLQGIYEQAQPGTFMLRVKVPGGVLLAEQADALAELAQHHTTGVLHLTTRMSIELHGIREAALDDALRGLRVAGLTSRGACGGAVRGVAVSTPLAPGCEEARILAARIQHHFTGNPTFEGLPKKFKVGVDAGYAGARHLIQDVGLVLVGFHAGSPRWDVWVGGGLGRQPRAAFLAAQALSDIWVIPLLEAVVRLYQARVPAGKRLKHWVAEVGDDAVRKGLKDFLNGSQGGPVAVLAAPPETGTSVVAPVFAGEISHERLRSLAGVARTFSDDRLILTPNQDIAFPLADPSRKQTVLAALTDLGFGSDGERGVALRVCPGTHECKLGLAPTRDAARLVVDAMGQHGRRLSWAVSGCPNSCAQPQLADVGVLCTRLTREAGGERQPLYDLLRREGDGLGRTVLRQVSLAEILDAVRALG